MMRTSHPSDARRSSLVELKALDPLRSPSWRWQLAGELASPGRRMPAGVRDAQLAAAVDYLRRLRRGQREETARRAQPHVAAALEIFERGGPLQWEIEARLLAGQAPTAIAERVAGHVDTVHAYAELFFNVCDALDARDWIVACVLERTPWTRDEPVEAALWRYGGWMDGPVLVDALVGEYHGRPAPDRPQRAALAQKARVAFTLRFGDARAAAQVVDDAARMCPDLVAREPRWATWREQIHLAAGRPVRRQRPARKIDDETDRPTPRARRRRTLRVPPIARPRITPLRVSRL